MTLAAGEPYGTVGVNNLLSYNIFLYMVGGVRIIIIGFRTIYMFYMLGGVRILIIVFRTIYMLCKNVSIHTIVLLPKYTLCAYSVSGKNSHNYLAYTTLYGGCGKYSHFQIYCIHIRWVV